MRMALMIMTVFHLAAVVLIAALTGGLFADGGGLLDRALLAVVHPAAAVALILALARDDPKTWLVALAVALALVNIAGDAYFASAIYAGAVPGDFWLPLIFAVIPAAGAAYLGARVAASKTASR